jgi:hypothetical protein
MTLPVSGAISFNAINVELGVAGTTSANINQTSYRTLAGITTPGTTISLSNFYGKSNRATASYTFLSSTANASLNLSSLGGYVAGITDITVTVSSGVYLYATSTGNYGLSLSGATSGDTVTIVNNGFIMGQGGNGGGGASGNGNATLINGTAGGPALNLGIGVNPTINNQSGYIGGGGGGGGGYVQTFGTPYANYGAGGGAGGGNGGGNWNYNGQSFAAGGSGGAIGSAGQTPATSPANRGGGGGRIMPATNTQFTGNNSSDTSKFKYSFGLQGTGGQGGGTGRAEGIASSTVETWNQLGGGTNTAAISTLTGFTFKTGGGSSYFHFAGSGGGYGAAGSNYSNGGNTYVGSTWGVGAAGGKAVNLNGRSITWTGGSASTSRVYGAVS